MADTGLGFWSNLVSIGTDLTGGIMSAALTMNQNSKQRTWSSEEAAKQRQFAHQERVGAQEWAREMWNLNNMYNTPTRQMQRMMAAGINPNSAAGLVQAGDSSAPPASIAPAAGASASMPTQFNEAEAIPSMLNATANYKAQLAQADLAKAMTDKTQQETTGLIIDNGFKPFEKNADLSLALEKIKLMEAQGELSHAQASSAMEMLPYLKGRTAAEIQQINEDILNKSAERSRILESIHLLSQQIETEKHKQKQMDAAAFEAYQNGKEAKSAIELNGKRMSLAEAETLLKTIEHDKEEYDLNLRKEYREKYGFDINEHGVDRVLSNFGYVIERQGTALQSLWDSTKTKLNSIGSSLKSSLLPKENGYQPSEPYYER